MLHPHRSALFAAGLLALSACNRSEQPTQPKAGDPVAAAEQISALEGRWSRDYGNMDAGKIASYFAEDATVMQPGAPELSGLPAIQAAVSEVGRDENFSIEFKNEKIDVAESGDLAYSRGRYTQQATNPDTKQIETATGTYLTVYRRQPDGNWKAVDTISTQ